MGEEDKDELARIDNEISESNTAFAKLKEQTESRSKEISSELAEL